MLTVSKSFPASPCLAAYPGGLSAARGAQGALNDESIEGFGGQGTLVELVEWRRGRVDRRTAAMGRAGWA